MQALDTTSSFGLGVTVVSRCHLYRVMMHDTNERETR
jgi:hypothetical protein